MPKTVKINLRDFCNREPEQLPTAMSVPDSERFSDSDQNLSDSFFEGLEAPDDEDFSPLTEEDIQFIRDNREVKKLDHDVPGIDTDESGDGDDDDNDGGCDNSGNSFCNFNSSHQNQSVFDIHRAGYLVEGITQIISGSVTNNRRLQRHEDELLASYVSELQKITNRTFP